MNFNFNICRYGYKNKIGFYKKILIIDFNLIIKIVIKLSKIKNIIIMIFHSQEKEF
jgi:hypothetical protein